MRKSALTLLLAFCLLCPGLAAAADGGDVQSMPVYIDGHYRPFHRIVVRVGGVRLLSALYALRNWHFVAERFLHISLDL